MHPQNLNENEPHPFPEEARGEKPATFRDRLPGILSLLLKLAAIVPVFFAFLIVFTMEDDDSPGLFLLILSLGGLLALLLFTFGELVRVFHATSVNTRRILERLNSQNQR